jgi:hypothetical protein
VLDIGANELVDGGDEGSEPCDHLQTEAEVSNGLVLVQVQLPSSMRWGSDILILRQRVGK